MNACQEVRRLASVSCAQSRSRAGTWIATRARVLSRVALISLLLTGLALPVRPAQAEPLRFNQTDKQMHLLASYGASMSLNHLYRKPLGKVLAPVASLATVLAIGHLKERTDSRYDPNDMKANALGALSGTLFYLSF